MEKGYVENGFIVDVSNARKSSEIIYELSNILDLPDAQSKKVRLKLGEIDLNASQLSSIKALVECMNSEIEFISTYSEQTINSAQEIGVDVRQLENKIAAPEFDADREESDKELEKALDNIFGDTEYKFIDNVTAYQTLEMPSETDEEAVVAAEAQPVVDDENADFNAEIESANQIAQEVVNAQAKEQMRATEKLPTLYIQRTVRSGQSLSSEGNLVVIGDVHPGAEVAATGDITVWGVLGGIAHAGSEGNRYARIRALKMNAIQLRIAEIFSRRPDSVNVPYIQRTDTFTPEEASIRKTQIIIQRIKGEI